ncbi:hypothetical protein D3C85_1859650 [compost metagenome]
MIKEDLGSTMHLCKGANLIGLATPYKQRRIRSLALACDSRDRNHPCRLRKQTQFLKLQIEMGHAKIYPNQKDSSLRG